MELPEDQRNKILKDIKEFQSRLLTANARNLPLLSSMISDWIKDITK
jgi:hypothetical protein